MWAAITGNPDYASLRRVKMVRAGCNSKCRAYGTGEQLTMVNTHTDRATEKKKKKTKEG